MIKRMLGFDGQKDSDGETEDEPMSEAQKAKLVRRLLPGGETLGKLRSKTGAAADAAEEEESSEEEEYHGDGSQEESDDDVFAVPEVEVEQDFKGRFHSKLFPDKILNSQASLDAHMNSKRYLRAVKKAKHIEEVGYEAYAKEQEEQVQRAEARKESGELCGKARAKKKYFQMLKEKQKKAKQKRKEQGTVKEKTPEEVAWIRAKNKAKDERKKQRRQEEEQRREEEEQKDEAKMLRKQQREEEVEDVKKMAAAVEKTESREPIESKKKKKGKVVVEESLPEAEQAVDSKTSKPLKKKRKKDVAAA